MMTVLHIWPVDRLSMSCDDLAHLAHGDVGAAVFSILTVGFTAPVHATAEGRIVDGFDVYAAACYLDEAEVPVIVEGESV